LCVCVCACVCVCVCVCVCPQQHVVERPGTQGTFTTAIIHTLLVMYTNNVEQAKVLATALGLHSVTWSEFTFSNWLLRIHGQV